MCYEEFLYRILGTTRFEEPVFIIYRTKSLLNQEFYVGKHCTKNLNDGYMGSGLRIMAAIKKYGKFNFKVDILHILDSKDKANFVEKQEIAKYWRIDPLCLNLGPGGEGPTCPLGHSEALSVAMKRYYENPESRKKNSYIQRKHYKENPERRRQIRLHQLKWWEDHPEAREAASDRTRKRYENLRAREAASDIQLKWWEDHPEAREAASDRTRKRYADTPEIADRISKSLTGLKKSSDHCQAMSLCRIGHDVTQETRDRISGALTGRSLSLKHREALSAALIGVPKTLKHREAMSLGWEVTSNEAKTERSERLSYAWQSKSEEKKQEISEKISVTKQAKSVEEKLKISEKQSESHQNKSEKQKAEIIEKRLITRQSWSEEDKQKSMDKFRSTWHNRSDEAKVLTRERKSIAAKAAAATRKAKLAEEDRLK